MNPDKLANVLIALLSAIVVALGLYFYNSGRSPVASPGKQATASASFSAYLSSPSATPEVKTLPTKDELILARIDSTHGLAQGVVSGRTDTSFTLTYKNQSADFSIYSGTIFYVASGSAAPVKSTSSGVLEIGSRVRLSFTETDSTKQAEGVVVAR